MECRCGEKHVKTNESFSFSDTRLKRHAKENGGCTVPGIHRVGIFLHCIRDKKRV